MGDTIAALRTAPVSDDVLLRAKAPLLEAFDNALKSNVGWLLLVDRAQTEPDRIDRLLHGKERIAAITSADLQALARRYLTANRGLEVTVLPEGKEASAVSAK
jgi:zinc protease